MYTYRWRLLLRWKTIHLHPECHQRWTRLRLRQPQAQSRRVLATGSSNGPGRLLSFRWRGLLFSSGCRVSWRKMLRWVLCCGEFDVLVQLLKLIYLGEPRRCFSSSVAYRTWAGRSCRQSLSRVGGHFVPYGTSSDRKRMSTPCACKEIISGWVLVKWAKLTSRSRLWGGWCQSF